MNDVESNYNLIIKQKNPNTEMCSDFGDPYEN